MRMENAYPMGDTDWQGNLMMPAMAATNGAATGSGRTGARIGTGVSAVAGARGGGADGGNGGGGDGMMGFGGMLNGENVGDDEDTGPEPSYVFSVPHWETIKAGVSSFFLSVRISQQKTRLVVLGHVQMVHACHCYVDRQASSY